MTKKRKKLFVSYIIVKGKNTKKDILDWCRDHKEELDSKSSYFKFIKQDKDYFIYVRPKYKFKRLAKQNKNGYKIYRGYLK